jgi:hypothetical protein
VALVLLRGSDFESSKGNCHCEQADVISLSPNEAQHLDRMLCCGDEIEMPREGGAEHLIGVVSFMRCRDGLLQKERRPTTKQ